MKKVVIWSVYLAAALGHLCSCTAHRDANAPPSEAAAGPQGDTFALLMHGAMERMDRGMGVACTDNPDRDFAAMMIPHHQGAVDMAVLELRFGQDERLRRLAQAIIVEQRQEIALMQSILSDPATPPAPADDDRSRAVPNGSRGASK